MIVDAARTWALVVAADRYDAFVQPPLQTPARDTVDVLRWLTDIGVPQSQMIIHLATDDQRRAEVQARLAPLGLRLDSGAAARGSAEAIVVRPVEHQAIGKSLAELKIRQDAETLLVFFMGHGVLTGTKAGEAGDRLFLCADFTADYPANVSIDSVVEKLLILPFRNSIVFFDACSKIESAAAEAPRLIAHRLQFPVGDPNPEAGVYVVYASQQYAPAIEQPDEAGVPHSVFMRALLDALHPDRVHPLFLESDPDGHLVANLVEIVERQVSSAVRAATGQQQCPGAIPHGRYEATGVVPIFRIASGLDAIGLDTLKQNLQEWAGSLLTADQVATALDYREFVTKVRNMYHLADELRDWTGAVEGVAADHPDHRAMVDALWTAMRDIQGETATTFGAIPKRLRTTQLTKARNDAEQTVANAFRQLVPAPSVSEAAYRTEMAALVIRDAALRLRTALEDAYALATWLALRRSFLDPDAPQAIEMLRLWAVLADSSRLADKAQWAGRLVDVAGGHIALEPTQWWPRVDELTPADTERLRVEIDAVAEAVAKALDDPAKLGDALDEIRDRHRTLAALIDSGIVTSLRRRILSGSSGGARA